MAHYVATGRGEWLAFAIDVMKRSGHTITMDRIPEEHRKNVVVLFESDKVPEHLYLVRANPCAQERYGVEVPKEFRGTKGAIAVRVTPRKRDKTLAQADRHNLQKKMLEAGRWFE